MFNSEGAGAGGQLTRKQLSLGTQFKQQLSELLTMLGNTNPNFVRCLKVWLNGWGGG